MKIIKVLLLVLVIIVVCVVVVFTVALSNLDRAAKIAIEKGGTYALGVETTLAKADIGVFAGSFSLSALTVTNPDGFNSPHFLSLGDGFVSVSYTSLLDETITLPALTLSSIDVYLDKENGSSNYERIMENLKRFESGDAPAQQDTKTPSKKLIIQSLEITDITVHADVLGNDPVEVKIDAIRLTNVGSEGGDTLELAGVAGVVVKSIMLAAVQAGAGVLPDAILGELQSGLAGLDSLSDLGIGVAAEIGGTVQDLGGLADDISAGVIQSAEELGGALEDAGKGLEDAAKGLGGLFGGSADDDEEGDN